MFRFEVPDMNCGACVRRVTKAVHSVDPAARVEADPSTREVRVQSSAGSAALMKALDEAGYPVASGA